MKNTLFNHAAMITGFWYRIGNTRYSTPTGSFYGCRYFVIHVNPLQGFLQTIVHVNPFQGFVGNCWALLHGIQGNNSTAILKGLNINRIINRKGNNPERVEYEPIIGYL